MICSVAFLSLTCELVVIMIEEFHYDMLVFATLLNFVVYELGIIFCKGIIFYIIIRDDEITTTKQVLMAMISLVPIFLGLFG